MQTTTHQGGRTERSTEIKTGTLVADTLRQWIVNGELAPGQRLIEADLRKSLDASRSTVREVLIQLNGEGLVELVHQRGAFVTRLSEKELLDLFGVRERLEGYAAWLAAKNVAVGQNRKWLKQQQKTWQQADMSTNYPRHLQENIPFHEGILRMSGNDRLVSMLQRLQIPSIRQRFFDAFEPGHWKKSVEEHLGIIDALLAGDSERAESAMRKHVRRTGKLASQRVST